ncbi:hypothetical protein AVEN_124343-1, partial [Araneus ventricosus]
MKQTRIRRMRQQIVPQPSWAERMENGQIDRTEHQKYGGDPKRNLPIGSEEDYFTMLFTNDMCEKIRE